MIYRGRFAPSPSGHLHIGSLTAAVGSWLCARHAAGPWLVRIEDIDPPREVEGSAASILAALPAFGPVADGEPLYQSRRVPAYDPAFEQLRDVDRIFPCWCSRSDLAGSAGMHRDAHCVAAPDSAKPPAWRVRAPDIEIAFDDALQGPQKQNLREAAGDFVIRRAEGFHGYQLACVVDDAQQGMTEVVRGRDLLDSTARQIWLQQCLGLPPPSIDICRWRWMPTDASCPSGQRRSRSIPRTRCPHCGRRSAFCNRRYRQAPAMPTICWPGH